MCIYIHANLCIYMFQISLSLSPSLSNTSYCNTYMHILKLLMYKFLKTYLYTSVQVLPNAFDCLMYIYNMYTHHRRKFRSQASDNMDRWKSRGGKSQRREEKKKEDHRRKRVRGEKMQVREKVKKVAKHCVFPMICGSGGSKSRLAKAAGAEPSGQMRDERLHAVVARSTFRSQNVQSTPF